VDEALPRKNKGHPKVAFVVWTERLFLLFGGGGGCCRSGRGGAVLVLASGLSGCVSGGGGRGGSGRRSRGFFFATSSQGSGQDGGQNQGLFHVFSSEFTKLKTTAQRRNGRKPVLFYRVYPHHTWIYKIFTLV
jgi:hypothetical protein